MVAGTKTLAAAKNIDSIQRGSRPFSHLMRSLIVRFGGAPFLLGFMLVGCSKLGLGGKSQAPDLPSQRALKAIHYMTRGPGPNGRPLFDHLSQARTCHDLQIAMRWDRPPNVKGGPFDDEMVYPGAAIPADLAKDSEVFITGTVKQGEPLASGGSVWALRLKGGGELQAVEPAQYSDKQEEAQQAGGHPTMVHPFTPGRMLCGYGVYQGDIGMALNGHGHVPLLSMFFAMDRRR